MHGARERHDQIMPDGQRDRGLADPACADDRDKTRGCQLRRERSGVAGPPSHAQQAAWQIGLRVAGGGLPLRFVPTARP
jgi:hypothetical protein